MTIRYQVKTFDFGDPKQNAPCQRRSFSDLGKAKRRIGRQRAARVGPNHQPTIFRDSYLVKKQLIRLQINRRIGGSF